MLVQYTVKVTIINNINDEVITFNKAYGVEIEGDNIYDNYHILLNNIYVLDLFKDEVKEYCETEYISEDDIIIDEYEIYTETEGVDVFFENPDNPQEFTLTPNIKCYISPLEKPVPIATLSGVAYDSNTIIWSWSEEDCEYNHYLISEPMNPENEEDKQYIVATISAGEKRYIETNLEPDTAYSRRLINFSETQTALYSSEVTVTTECVNIESNITDFQEEKEYDFTITDKERELIEENLPAFKSGVGDLNDLKVYKQMDKDFYEKFKAYYVIKGKYFVKEKRYDQVGFNYKVCLEGTQTINEQEGEVTFKLDAYPWQELYKSEYLWTVAPLKIYAQVGAWVDLFKENSDNKTVNKDVEYKIKIREWIPEEYYPDEPIYDYVKVDNSTITAYLSIVIDLSSSMKYAVAANKYNKKTLQPFNERIDKCRSGAQAAIDRMEIIKASKGFQDVKYIITTFATSASTTAPMSASQAKSFISGLNPISGGATHWDEGILSACTALAPYTANGSIVGMVFFTDGFPNESKNSTTSARTWNCLYRIATIVTTTLPMSVGTMPNGKAKCYCVFCCDPNQGDPDYDDVNPTGKGSEDNIPNYNALAREYMENACFAVSPPITDGDEVLRRFTEAVNGLFDVQDQYVQVQIGTKPGGKVPGTGEWTTREETKHEPLDITVPWNPVDYKTVYIETEPVSFTMLPEYVTVEYSEQTKRAEVTVKMPERIMYNQKSIRQMLIEAMQRTDAYRSGYTDTNKAIDPETGQIIGNIFKNVVIKDAYYFGDEDIVSAGVSGSEHLLKFNAKYDYGYTGTINVYTDAANLNTSTNTDDEYLITDNNYLLINGYSNAMIFDWTRVGHANVNKLVNPTQLVFSRQELWQNLRNREIKSSSSEFGYVTYNNIAPLSDINSTNVHKKDLLYRVPDPCYITLIGNGIDQDMSASIDVQFSSPVLNYRFDITDPDAFTPYYEILPDCNPKSEDKHAIVLTIYKANNITCDCSSTDPHDFRAQDFDSERDNVPAKEYRYGVNSTWNAATGVNNCDGHWISQYVHFYAYPMTKDIDYYDELPANGEESMYGLVNGRYRENNLSGKQDLIVQLPRFNIPNNVHNDWKIYVVITEFYPQDALVSYVLENEAPKGSGYTHVNGDNCTFSSDILIYKKIPYEDRVATLDSDYMELFNQEPYDIIQDFTRPTTLDEDAVVQAYTYNSLPQDYVYKNTISVDHQAIIIDEGSYIDIPVKNLYRGRYQVVINGLNIHNDGLSCSVDGKDAILDIEEQTQGYIQFSFNINSDEVKETIIRLSCIVEENEGLTYFKTFNIKRTSGKYNNYYLEVTTNNDNVLPIKYPSEIHFDKDNKCEVPMSFLGVINATSKWSPRIHNGYYYINQHEKYLHTDFDVKADFDETTRYEYAQETIFITFNVDLLKEAAPAEHYDIVKDTKALLLQNEKLFTWEDGKGLTILPAVEGMFYKHYEPREWISPIILFPNPLSSISSPLKLDYENTDGSTEGLELYIRIFDVDECVWTDWELFENNIYPTMNSCAYQIKTVLTATENHRDYEDDDYWCCYLDWKERLDLDLCQNIVIDTDHIMTNVYDTDGIAYSNIIEFACPSGISFEKFATSNRVIVNVAYSNKRDDLILENVVWHPMETVNTGMKYHYYRFMITVPKGEKLYWLHYTFRTLESTVVLPYIKSLTMSGNFVPRDTIASFSKVESYTIPKDGLLYEVVPRIGDIIEEDITARGFMVSNINQISITSNDPDKVLLDFDQAILNIRPNINLLDGNIRAALNEQTIARITQLPYIFVKRGKIEIKGTPQQYSPITVEDVNGIPYKRIYNVNLDDMTLTEVYDVTIKEKYIELKRTDFEIDTVKIYINDDLLDKEEYQIVNHLILFNDYYDIGDTITITYNVENSFYVDIDRENNLTTIYPYKNQEDYELPDEYMVDDEEVKKKYKVMFETNVQTNKYVNNNLSLNPTYRTEYNGFIYLTEEHNVPYKINIWCNPRRIKANGLDSVDISVEVLDIIDNPIINKTVKIDCNYGTIICDNYNTDMNGVIHAVYKSSYLACDDHVIAKVLMDDETTNIQEEIIITNYS